MLVIYRSPTSKFKHFLTQLDTKLQSLYTLKLNLVICGDINVNYCNDNDKRNKFVVLLNSYNLVSKTDFRTRICNDSSSAIDNILIDITR